MHKLLLILLIPIALLAQYAVTGPGGLVIELDTLDGFFGIGDTVGVGRPLMFDFHYPWESGNSSFAIMIDSVVYNNNLWLAASCGQPHLRTLRGPISTSADGFATQWSIPMGTSGSIIFTQRLRAVVIDDLPACEISYMALNNDIVDHRIAFRQAFDVLVGVNDNAPMAMSATYTALGNILDSTEMPYFWMAFEESPGVATDQVVARGILRGLATTPEIFAFGDYFALNDDCWEPDPFVIDHIYHDSGVSLLWQEKQVSPDKAYGICTIYGFGQAPEPGSDVMVMFLVPNSIGSACDHWAQNPFEAAVMVNNIDITDGIDSLWACIQLDDGLALDFDAIHESDTCVLLSPNLLADSTVIAAWLILADSAYFTSPTDANVTITLSSITPEFGVRAGTTSVHIPHPMGVPPTIEDLLVPRNAISGIVGTSLKTKFLIEDESGIDPATMILQIGPVIHYIGDDPVDFDGDTLELDIPTYWFLHGNQIFHGIIAVSDSDGCSPDSMPHVFDFWIDTNPPRMGAPYPPSGAVITDSLQTITVPIYDEPAGVYEPSISAYIEIDGLTDFMTILAPELTYYADESLLVYTPSEPWIDHASVIFCVSGVSDDCDVGPLYTPRNHFSDTFCVGLTVDYGAIDESGKPLEFALAAYPNPFNAAVSISAPLAERLEIFDINGRLIADFTAKLDGTRNRGLVWDGISGGEHLPSGIYFLRAERHGNAITRRIVLLR